MFFYELRGISYIIKRKVSVNISKGTMTSDDKKDMTIYEYLAEKKVKWKVNETKLAPQFEMEDAYVYDKKIFFNTEGGVQCYDLVGQSGK